MPDAEVKRSFGEVLDAAERGEETVVLRRGRPVAIIAPVPASSDIRSLPKPRKRGGLLALAGTFTDWETMEEDMAEIVAARQFAKDRPPPEFE